MKKKDNYIDEEEYDLEKTVYGDKKNKKEGRKTGIGIKIYALFTTLVLGVLAVSTMYLYKKVNEEKKEVITYEEMEKDNGSEVKTIVKDYMENGKGTMAMLREIFPENIVVYAANKYLFIPVIEGVPMNDIDNNNINILDNGELQYMKNDKVISHKGIDVSKYQGDIDWEKVAADGVEFAMIRVGYRGYGTGAMVLDEMAAKNLEGATKAGIKVGVYFFSQAVSEKEAKEEAEFVMNCIKDYKITYPVVFDTEEVLNDEARTERLSVDELTQITVAFCDEISKGGYTPAIYANLRWFALSLDMSKLSDYDKWYAYYDKEIYFPYKIDMWQYTENGSVDGIVGNVDMNISFKDYE